MPDTRHLQADDPADLYEAARLLRDGALVAFATETVYGLGANALSRDAVAKIFAAKRRPAWDPLIVHLACVDRLGDVANVREPLRERVSALTAAFWPGPLTLLLPRNDAIPDAVTAGRPLVGVRVPAHPVAAAVLALAGVPVAAPSANTFGHTSPTTAGHVLADLDGRIDAVLDAGPASIGVESTVLDPTQTPMVLYRPGAVTAGQLSEACGVACITYAPEAVAKEKYESLPSPGVGIRHYAPAARLVLCEGIEEHLVQAVELARSADGKVGVLLPSDWTGPQSDSSIVMQPWGSWRKPDELAALLFSGLRALDDAGVSVIVCPLPEPGGLADAIRDRLLKAAKAK